MDFDFPVKMTTLDGAPAEFHPLYAEKDGAFNLNPILAKKIADLGNLTKSLEAERKNAGLLKSQLKAFGDRKPEEIASALEELQALKDKIEAGEIKPSDNAKIDELLNARLERVNKGHEREISRYKEDLAKKDQAIASLDTMLRRVRMEQALLNAASEVGVKKHSLEDAVANAMRMFEPDAEYNPKPKDTSGLGQDATPAKYFSEIKDSGEKPGWFFDPQNSGYDATTGGMKGGGKRISRADFERLNPQTQREYALGGWNIF